MGGDQGQNRIGPAGQTLEQRRRLGRRANLAHAALQGVDRLGGRQGRVGLRLSQALVEGTELEEVEQLPHRRRVKGTPRHLVGPHLERDVAPQHHHLGVLAGPVLVVGQVLAQLGRERTEVGEDAVEASVGGDELGRRLLPHSRHAGKVVRRVAP